MNFQEFRKSLSEAKNEEGKPQTTKTFASATPGQPPVVFDVDPRYDGQKIAKELDPAGGIKHQMGHALSRQDNDVDGDVDSQDKHTPDEVVGTPDETDHMLKKNADERKHTKKGVAYESTQKEGVVDTADVKVTASGRKVRAHRIEVDKDDDDSMKEASMSDDQMKKREDIVKGMKKNFSDFVSRYGKDAKSVMYATATKNAMKEEVELEEAMGVDPISHKTYVKGGVPRSGRSVERHKFAITATVKGRGGREEKIEQESHARGTKDEAEAKLRDHFTNRLGYKISSMKHMGVVKEEVELDEAATNYDKNNKAHQVARKTVKGMSGVAKAEYHADGSASVHTKSNGHISSTRAVDHHHDIHGLGYNRSESEYKNYTDRDSNGLTHSTKATPTGHTIHIHKEAMVESAKTGNEGRGYHGQHESDVADRKYSAMHTKVKSVAAEAGHLRDAKKPNVMVKHYLDSQHGRHLAGHEDDHEYIKKDFGKFKRTYKAEMHEEVELEESKIKVGDTIVWNKGKTAQTVGVVHKIETDHYIVHHTRTNTYHKLPKQGSELVESVELSEATDKTSQRLVQLVRFGLMDKSKLPLLTRAMASLDKGSVSNPSERQVLFELLDDLIGIVTGDDSTFSKIKMQVQK